MLADDDGKLLMALDAIMPKNDQDYGNPEYNPQSFLNLQVIPERAKKGRLFSAESLPEIYNLYYIMTRPIATSEGPMIMGIRRTYEWLKNDIVPKKKQLYDQNQPELFPLIIFDDPLLSLQKEREAKVLALQNDEGTLTDTRSCSKCNNPQVRIKTIQDRSVDEGASTHFTCPKCTFSWKEG